MFPNINLVYYDFLSFLWKLCKDTFSLYKFVANFYCYSSYLKHKNTINLTSPKQYIYYLQSERKKTKKNIFIFLRICENTVDKTSFSFSQIFFIIFIVFVFFNQIFVIWIFSSATPAPAAEKRHLWRNNTVFMTYEL